MRSLLTKREGETKLGETIDYAKFNWKKELVATSAKFVVLGIREDIGVRANLGIGGAHTNWAGFIKTFVNIQETSQLSGSNIFLLGQIDFNHWTDEGGETTVPALRKITASIDEMVYPIIQEIVAAGKIPIVIGGGHNYAYPIIKGTSMGKKTALNVVNLDAHSDFRIAEGRHSGNGFRYAYDEQYLIKYAMLGLHEAYNSNTIVTELNSNTDMLPLMWEDIFLREKYTWPSAIQAALNHVSQTKFGVELDIDSIERALSSAATPVGVSTQQAMQYLYQCGLAPNASYLHLPEAVSKRADGQQDFFTGKLLSYLVQAFVKGVLER